ncbi:unnamed protein product [Amoebophrya sp. A120]|nr:unnamed protein product [Amoebophrya sp. A120]|eukprot:GSA120T00019732001.1
MNRNLPKTQTTMLGRKNKTSAASSGENASQEPPATTSPKEASPTSAKPAKRGRGRPKGSKNKCNKEPTLAPTTSKPSPGTLKNMTSKANEKKPSSTTSQKKNPQVIQKLPGGKTSAERSVQQNVVQQKTEIIVDAAAESRSSETTFSSSSTGQAGGASSSSALFFPTSSGRQKHGLHPAGNKDHAGDLVSSDNEISTTQKDKNPPSFEPPSDPPTSSTVGASSGVGLNSQTNCRIIRNIAVNPAKNLIYLSPRWRVDSNGKPVERQKLIGEGYHWRPPVRRCSDYPQLHRPQCMNKYAVTPPPSFSFDAGFPRPGSTDDEAGGDESSSTTPVKYYYNYAQQSSSSELSSSTARSNSSGEQDEEELELLEGSEIKEEHRFASAACEIEEQRMEDEEAEASHATPVAKQEEKTSKSSALNYNSPSLLLSDDTRSLLGDAELVGALDLEEDEGHEGQLYKMNVADAKTTSTGRSFTSQKSASTVATNVHPVVETNSGKTTSSTTCSTYCLNESASTTSSSSSGGLHKASGSSLPCSSAAKNSNLPAVCKHDEKQRSSGVPVVGKHDEIKRHDLKTIPVSIQRMTQRMRKAGFILQPSRAPGTTTAAAAEVKNIKQAAKGGAAQMNELRERAPVAGRTTKAVPPSDHKEQLVPVVERTKNSGASSTSSSSSPEQKRQTTSFLQHQTMATSSGLQSMKRDRYDEAAPDRDRKLLKKPRTTTSSSCADESGPGGEGTKDSTKSPRSTARVAKGISKGNKAATVKESANRNLQPDDQQEANHVGVPQKTSSWRSGPRPGSSGQGKNAEGRSLEVQNDLRTTIATTTTLKVAGTDVFNGKRGRAGDKNNPVVENKASQMNSSFEKAGAGKGGAEVLVVEKSVAQQGKENECKTVVAKMESTATRPSSATIKGKVADRSTKMQEGGREQSGTDVASSSKEVRVNVVTTLPADTTMNNAVLLEKQVDFLLEHNPLYRGPPPGIPKLREDALRSYVAKDILANTPLEKHNSVSTAISTKNPDLLRCVGQVQQVLGFHQDEWVVEDITLTLRKR